MFDLISKARATVRRAGDRFPGEGYLEKKGEAAAAIRK
jgi:hypothetical protein